MRDSKILEMLVNKYGKEEVLNVINEAFKSERLNDYDDRIRKHNRVVDDKANVDRLSRMSRLYKKHYDRDNFDGDVTDLGYRDYSDDEKLNRQRYEANASDIQYKFERFIQENKTKALHDILSGWGLNYIDWHNVSDEDFIVVDKSKVRKYTRDYNYVVFWEDRNGDIFAITREKDVCYIRKSLRYKSGRYFNADNTKIKDLIEDANVGDAIVLNISKFSNNRRDIKNSRQTLRHGMIDRTPEQNERIRTENINRYKRIIAQNNISKFDRIDKDVRNAIKAFATFTAADDSDLNIVFKANKLVQELLSYYVQFTKNRKDLNNASVDSDSGGGIYSRAYSTGEYYNEGVKKNAKLISQTIEKLKDVIQL